MNAAAAISLLVELLRQAAAISTLVKQAQDERRDLTTAELSAVAERDDIARSHLVLAIAKAKAEGK